MTSDSVPPRIKNRRRFFKIDRAMRWPAVLTVGGMLGATILMAVTRSRVLAHDGLARSSTSDLAQLALLWDVLFFLSAITIVAWYAVVVNHRYAGPEGVLERALDGILQHDLGRRTTLRKKDHLKGIAARIGLVQARTRADRDELRRFLEELDDCLARNDVEAARRTVATMIAARKLDVAPIGAGAPAPKITAKSASPT